MAHILDNPVWHALASHNQGLGNITEHAAHFDPAISPFAALAFPDPMCLSALYQMVSFNDTVILVSNKKLDVHPWNEIACVQGYQMLYHGPEYPDAGKADTHTLADEHISQMLTLTSLTKPGPYLSRTIDFGHYDGIFNEDTLIAMAGQRLHMPGFAEISAVCTHPAHLGKGYARHLLLRQVNRIQSAGEKPFLHVKSDNERAIKVYESLHFKIRTEIFFHVIAKSLE
jgi:ribosomal protein S18 acetylase RimI-like enzyme